ncbi:efflux RND transporter periplasmic adaptor subunit [Sphaerimonospora cavernae]|uniref:Efflux RND transporter periplasmic adaptor subunit n=1 Tax=Sphaerimonospora cavernae TaxID=1740611 RepID=A0ABV6UAM5_9ACTN
MTFRRGLLPLLAVPIVLVAGCTSAEPARAQIGTVARAPVSEVVEAPATVVARAAATMTAPVAGTVAAIYVQDGDTVKKGQILARISSPQAREHLAEAKKADRKAARPISMAGVPGGSGPPSGLGSAAVSPPSLNLTSTSLDSQVAQGFARARKATKAIDDPAIRAALLSAIDEAQARQRDQRRALDQVVANLNRSLNRSLNQVLSQVTGRLTTQLTGQLRSGLSGLTASMSSLQEASRSQTRAAVLAARRTVDALVVRAPFGGVVTLGGPSSGGAAGLGGLGALGGAGGLGGLGDLGALSSRLTAPGSGRSSGVIAAGVPVAAGDAIVTVTDVSTLTLSADVDETDVLLVKKGTPAQAEFDAVTGASYTATVVGVGISPKQGATGGVSYPVRLELGEGAYDGGGAAPAPKPGMSAVVRLTVRQSPDAVAVPASAVVTSGRDAIVWAVRDGRAERRVIRLGAQGDAVVEILAGVSPGERVVVRAADTIRPGQPLP